MKIAPVHYFRGQFNPPISGSIIDHESEELLFDIDTTILWLENIIHGEIFTTRLYYLSGD